MKYPNGTGDEIMLPESEEYASGQYPSDDEAIDEG
ncbi:hypothetical protein FHW69_001643 [Luteibacter sp. Sphag1AF]|nr:hypothetical protein [Luteibacter sp. Sphag1AF]